MPGAIGHTPGNESAGATGGSWRTTLTNRASSARISEAVPCIVLRVNVISAADGASCTVVRLKLVVSGLHSSVHHVDVNTCPIILVLVSPVERPVYLVQTPRDVAFLEACFVEDVGIKMQYIVLFDVFDAGVVANVGQCFRRELRREAIERGGVMSDNSRPEIVSSGKLLRVTHARRANGCVLNELRFHLAHMRCGTTVQLTTWMESHNVLAGYSVGVVGVEHSEDMIFLVAVEPRHQGGIGPFLEELLTNALPVLLPRGARDDSLLNGRDRCVHVGARRLRSHRAIVVVKFQHALRPGLPENRRENDAVDQQVPHNASSVVAVATHTLLGLKRETKTVARTVERDTACCRAPLQTGFTSTALCMTTRQGIAGICKRCSGDS
mmetsp:Transcript_69613/g.193720  ORF Transcript_69613/g.193720 Transcript_69613/m.193720 type:complete len:382 (-) Transcript_69613:753-1898(-)